MPRRASASTAPPAGVAVAASAAAGSAAGPSSKSPPVLPPTQAHPSAGPTSNPGGTTRPRRIMPSRSRRGGPGLGISDVDTHILETLRRRRENEPLVPAYTQLLLTTDSARVRTFGDAAAEADAPQLNTSAYERYFDQPEVIRAYREQQLIQTPEFTLLSEHEAVGGRFRPRSLDDEGIDTSDAAYEKRHRKYEAFEKRQRLREKEKLKHEHYKLKERIEQLRALEPSAFLSTPESYFVASLRPPLHHRESDVQDGMDTPPPAPPHNMGEWRKRQMLDVANSLDARYRTLLDTAPSRAPDLPTPTPPPSAPPTALRPQRILSLPPPPEVIELDSDGEEKRLEFVKVERAHAQPVLARHDTTESLKLRIKFPNRAIPPPSSPASPGAASSPKAPTSPSPSPTRPRPKPMFKNADVAPSPHVRIPFAKRVVPLQDGAAVDAPSPPSSSTHSPRQTAAALPSNSAAHPNLRRRPDRAAARPKHGSPAAATSAGVPTSRPQQPHPSAHPQSRLRKRPRVELSDADEESRVSDVEDEEESDDAARRYAQKEEEEEGEDEGDEDEDEKGGSSQERERERQRTRWRESALYREAQRHAGAPNARKTHRHLGIFGLRGFPAEVEHLRDFMLPQWALPRGDPRMATYDQWEAHGGTVRGAERVRGNAAVPGSGGGGDEDRDGRLRDAVAVAAVTENGESSSSCSNLDQMVVAETASAVDSQATEVIIS
ncbi:hypothetical protein BC827DRAFT_1216967 [Russula dissimulans]|nr:hypothetical protein BC827DRAFT_1216967 [Russula dissimulans]